MDCPVPVKMTVRKSLGKVVVVGFGYSLDDSVLGEFGVLNKIGSELSFGFHGEKEWDCSEAFELVGGFEKHGIYCS